MYLSVQQSYHQFTDELPFIEQMSRLSNNLFNEAVYHSRQFFFENGRKPWKVLSYPKLYKLLKHSDNALGLYSQSAQRILQVVNGSFKSFKQLSKLAKSGNLHFTPKLPNYRDKGGFNQILFTNQSLDDWGFCIHVPYPVKIQNEIGKTGFTIPKPDRLKGVKIRELRIIPKYGKWLLEYVYESLETVATSCKLIPERVLGLDPGVNNLLAGVTNTGEAFLIDGKALKTRNRLFNKEISRLRSILTKGKKPKKGITSKRIQQVAFKRANYVRDAINKTARYVIDFCIEHDIDTIILGRNRFQKQGINIGKVNNQNFAQIPHYKLCQRIRQLAEIYGKRFIDTEESYTSKASFFDNDFIPTYGEKPDGWKPSGTRKLRGLYKTANGWLINADCNGACNIMRKVSTTLGFSLSGVSRGAVTTPIKVKIGQLS